MTRATFVHTLTDVDVDVDVDVDWDPKKAEANLREHGVSFAERFVSLGMSATGTMLVVVYTHRGPDGCRLISSWKANKPQRKQYEKGRR